MHKAKITSGTLLAAILVFSIASIAMAARPAFAQGETRGQSWSSINTAVGDAEKTFETDAAGALAKVDQAQVKYESVFRSVAFEVDQATGEAIDQAFVDIRAAINSNTKIDVVLNKQVIDKLIYKIAFMKIEKSLDEATSEVLRQSKVQEAGQWFTVMTVKFGYTQNPSASSQAMAGLQANPSRVQELTPVILDSLKAQFLIKVREEVIEAVGALEKSPADTLNAQKFSQEGTMYYRTLQPDVAAKIGTEYEADLSHELEELMEASAAGDLANANEVAAEISALLDAYEGKESTGIAGALNTMKDMLTLVDIEYTDAVANGQIVDQTEYDETILFLQRATDTFKAAKAALMEVGSGAAGELEEDLATIATLVQNKADPAEVRTVVQHAFVEIEAIRAVAGGSADFATNIEFIRGHLEMAVANKNAGNIELALAHAGHPVEEVYSLITVQLTSADLELDAELESAMTTLANQIDTMSASQVESTVEDINVLLDDAIVAVVGGEVSDPVFAAMVMVLLLQTAGVEYSEAVEKGQIIEMIEYQDASAFIHRAEAMFEGVKDDMTAHEAEEVTEFFEELNSAVSSNAEPSQINIQLGGIIHELDEVFALEVEGAGELDGWGYIDHIHELLDEALEEYRAGNGPEARALAIEAYLDNYEFIEADIAEEDRPLMEKIEIDMRVELVQMIDQDRPVSEVEAHVEQIKTDLETARAVVTPEFPVAAIAAALAVAGTVAYTRVRTSAFGHRD
ncbi:hypothetical protein [Nitrososphaera sp.]|uniref:hypothetical protein n=1 Tax=Nitrososphaera sp. TaxID=1971748 RepID=UPI002ED90004